MSFDAFLGSIASERLRNVALHWQAARDSHLLPAWSDIRPSAIAAELSLIWAYKYDRAADSFTGRLAGDSIEQIVGKSFRGTPMSVLYDHYDYSVFFQRCKRVVCEPTLMRSEGTVFQHVERYGLGERIIMPLADDGIRGDGLFGATVYDMFLGTPNDPNDETASWFALAD